MVALEAVEVAAVVVCLSITLVILCKVTEAAAALEAHLTLVMAVLVILVALETPDLLALHLLQFP